MQQKSCDISDTSQKYAIIPEVADIISCQCEN